MNIQSTLININTDDMSFIMKEDETQSTYQTKPNQYVENSGVTIQNVIFPFFTENEDDTYILKVSDFGTNFECGKIIENLFLMLNQSIKNKVIIIDFDEVVSVSEEFSESLTKIILETTNKIIPINMSIRMTKTFGQFILDNFYEEEE